MCIDGRGELDGLSRTNAVQSDLTMTVLTANLDARVVLRNIPWDIYEGLLSARGDDPAPKLTYDGGTLEIMSPSGLHEWIKKILGRFVESFTFERGIDVRSAGSTTFRLQLKAKGLEPDESYYLENEPRVRFKPNIDLAVDPAPDLAIEIDVTTSSVDKLGIYSSLGVKEVWGHDDSGVVLHALESSGSYSQVEASRVLPGLTASILNRFLVERSCQTENGLVRLFRDWVRSLPIA